MIYFAIALTALFVLNMLSSLWLYVGVAQASTRYYSLLGFTIGMLLSNGFRVGLLVWVWMLV